MNHLKATVLLLFILTNLKSVAQNSNAEKILGCWIFKELQFSEQVDFAEELNKNAKNTVVCFTSDGNFTNSKSGVASNKINGTYKISEDGKTITQKSDISSENEDESAEIHSIDDKLLVFKLEFGKMVFERK